MQQIKRTAIIRLYVGNLSDEDVEAYVEKAIKKAKEYNIIEHAMIIPVRDLETKMCLISEVIDEDGDLVERFVDHI